MGWVWNIVLSFDNEELWVDGEDEPCEIPEPLERINEWIPDGRLVDLTPPTYKKGAGYGLDANLYGGGFKHFDIDAFIELVRVQNWKEPNKVQLWIKGGEAGMGEKPFTFMELSDRKPKKSPAATRTPKKPKGQSGKSRRGGKA